MFGEFRTIRKAGIDPPFTHHPAQSVWCTGDSVRNQFVHVWRCFASFGAANVNKKTRPMSRWCWWLQQPVGKPQSRNRRVCFGIPHACLFKKRDWKTIWKKNQKRNPSNSFHGHPLVESTNPKNPSDGLYRSVALNFHLFSQAQHGAETKQHHKNDVQFRHPSVSFEVVDLKKLELVFKTKKSTWQGLLENDLYNGFSVSSSLGLKRTRRHTGFRIRDIPKNFTTAYKSPGHYRMIPSK